MASSPGSSAARLNLGQVLERQGRIDSAIEEYLEALRLEPGHPDLHHHLGILLTSRGRHAEALRHLEIAVALAPDFRPALVALERLEQLLESRAND